MKTNKSVSIFLTLVLLLAAIVPQAVFAADDQTVPALLTVEEPIFSVTLPLSLPVTITEDGSIVTASGAEIVNHSAGPVVITNIKTRGINGWETVEYGTIDMTTAKVNTKNVSLQLTFGDELTGTKVTTTGVDTNDFTGFIRLAKDETLPLPYNAEVPAQTAVYVAEQFAEVVFTIGWDE